MLRIAVLLSGGGTDFQSIIDHMDEINGEIVLAVSNRKKAYGLERARNNGIDAMWIKDQGVLLNTLKEYKVDLVVLAGYLAIIKEDLINEYENRMINIHPSLIPSFCGPGMYGMHVHDAVLARGAKVSGCTVHFVSTEVDGGPIIAQKAVDISDLDKAEDIQARVLEYEHQLLPYVVKKYCDGKVKIENGRVKVYE